MKHSQTPWKLSNESVDPHWHIITAPGGKIMANVHIENDIELANAARIVACVNACAALPNPAEDIPAMIAALKRLCLSAENSTCNSLAIDAARAILAKVQP